MDESLPYWEEKSSTWFFEDIKFQSHTFFYLGKQAKFQRWSNLLVIPSFVPTLPKGFRISRFSNPIPHVLGQAQYTNGETRWTGKGSLECQNHEVSDTKHPFFVIYIWTDHCNPFNWSPAHSTGPQSIQLVPKFQYWLIQCQNGQFWQNKLILSFHCASPQPSQVVPGSFNWSSPHSTGPQVPVLAYCLRDNLFGGVSSSCLLLLKCRNPFRSVSRPYVTTSAPKCFDLKLDKSQSYRLWSPL